MFWPRVLMNAETWLTVDDKDPQILGFVFKHNPRAHCYKKNNPLFTKFKHQRGGEVGIYCSKKSESNIFIPKLYNL